MQADGESFTLASGYVWDGATVGSTTLRLLAPTLVHDALYHALMHRAPLAQREADRAFLALLRQWQCPHPCLSYRAVRLAGGLFNAPDDPPTLIIERGDPKAARKHSNTASPKRGSVQTIKKER